MDIFMQQELISIDIAIYNLDQFKNAMKGIICYCIQKDHHCTYTVHFT